MTASRPDSHLRPFCLILCKDNSSFFRENKDMPQALFRARGMSGSYVCAYTHLLEAGRPHHLWVVRPDSGIIKAGPFMGAGQMPIYSFAWYYYTRLPFYFKNCFIPGVSIFIPLTLWDIWRGFLCYRHLRANRHNDRGHPKQRGQTYSHQRLCSLLDI